MSQSLQYLQENFSLPGVLAFAENDQGLVYATVHAPSGTGELFLQGAHVTRWQPAGDGPAGEPALYLSPHSNFTPGKPIRGGVPVIFPWFGDRSAGLVDQRTDGPSHGFARTELWTLAFAALAGDDVHLTLTLEPSDTSRALGYPDFRLAYDITFSEVLRLRLTVANTGTKPLRFEEALHTYIAIADATQASITGLNDTEYLDKTDNLARKRQAEPVLNLTGETDRPYLNNMQTVWLRDPVLGRHTSVFKANSHTTVVWNPWIELSAKLPDLGPGEWQRFTCIEAANAADNAVTLEPGQAHTMEARIGVEAL